MISGSSTQTITIIIIIIKHCDRHIYFPWKINSVVHLTINSITHSFFFFRSYVSVYLHEHGKIDVSLIMKITDYG